MSLQVVYPGWLRQRLLTGMVVMQMMSFSSASRPASQPLCSERSPASYILVFSGLWSPQTFPKQYPLFRPPAQWSKLVAVTHNAQYRMWQQGALASSGVAVLAEQGLTAPVLKEAKGMRQGGGRSVGGLYRTPGISSGVGHSSTTMLLQPRTPLLSLLVKIVPSPDWFVGVDSLDLCEGGQWKQEVTLDLHPYDAGTDSGFTFSSPNFPSNPLENITQITAQSPSHPANSFFYPRLQELPPLASVRLTRHSSAPGRRPGLSNHIRPHPELGLPHYSETPLDCEVSLWSSWGLCQGYCGSEGGQKSRTRYILLPPANTGAPCPELEEQSVCSPDNCL
ncbi:spondin-2a [Amia ocellicauda]|uniref:spondin-2a n=1 Tax=Amia ocellicauda TaxID=2972642 RepID=UPI003463FBBA|nr:SPON2 protein [Amia calva]